jgi:uncharacterized protein
MKFYSLWLAVICIFALILQALIPGFTDALILNHSAFSQPWRFVTSIFLHGSVAHLIYNLFALVFFGMITEKLAGSRRFLVLFFASGILANLISVNFYSSSLGASGAIYGIIGCLTVLQPMMTVFAFSLPMPMFVASIIWTAGDILGLFIPSNTGHIAHLSGLVIGIIFGIYLLQKRIKIPKVQNTKLKIPESYIHDWEKHYLQ